MRLILSTLLAYTCVHLTTAAPSDSPRDADIGQSSYLGGAHNIHPDSLPQFKHLWNYTFNPDEKVCSPSHPLSSKQT
jgi:hypothetical protein